MEKSVTIYEITVSQGEFQVLEYYINNKFAEFKYIGYQKKLVPQVDGYCSLRARTAIFKGSDQAFILQAEQKPVMITNETNEEIMPFTHFLAESMKQKNCK
jgi:hypothetical protein